MAKICGESSRWIAIPFGELRLAPEPTSAVTVDATVLMTTPPASATWNLFSSSANFVIRYRKNAATLLLEVGTPSCLSASAKPTEKPAKSGSESAKTSTVSMHGLTGTPAIEQGTTTAPSMAALTVSSTSLIANAAPA